MAYRTYRKTTRTTRSAPKRRTTRTAARPKRMSAQRAATEAAFKRGVKSGMRMRRANSRRAYFYG